MSRIRARITLTVFTTALSIAAAAASALVRATIPAAERLVLVNIYNSTHGGSWTHNTNWCSGTCPLAGTPTFNAVGSECSWYGIGCDANQAHVVAVELAHNNLVGTLPALGGLTSLQYFSVVANVLTGSIPSLGGLTQLQTFYADSNQLSGAIPGLSGLTSLGDFSVRHNQLTGSIPALSGLTNLYSFSASS